MPLPVPVIGEGLAVRGDEDNRIGPVLLNLGEPAALFVDRKHRERDFRFRPGRGEIGKAGIFHTFYIS